MVPCQLLGLCQDEDVVYVDDQLHSRLSQLGDESALSLFQDKHQRCYCIEIGRPDFDVLCQILFK